LQEELSQEFKQFQCLVSITGQKIYLFYFIATPSRNFGILQEYRERKNKKLINNLLCTERPTYWVTSSRPSNFGDPLDTKTKADNWFDENRLWNEENKDYEIKRAQMYMM